MKLILIFISSCTVSCMTPDQKAILKILSEEKELLNDLYSNPAVLEAARELSR